MPPSSRLGKRNGALPADPIRPPSPGQPQPHLHHRSSQQLTPTSEFVNATLLDLPIPLAALRHVREVAAHILRRLEQADTPPPPPHAAPDSTN